MKNKFTSAYTNTEIEGLLEKADKKPFVLYYDEQKALYRFFSTEAEKNTYEYAENHDEMTADIEALPFTTSFTAPAPYSISFTSVSDNQFFLEGQTGITLSFSFMTYDGKNNTQPEPIDAYYTFRSPSGTKQASAIYDAESTVSMVIDDYVSTGTNSITIMIKGRSTYATKTIVVTYTIAQLDISSNFNIAQPIEAGKNFTVYYTVESGAYTKYVHFDIDNDEVATVTISDLETDVTKQQVISNSSTKYKPGKHTLQIYAEIKIGQTTYQSKLLYFEYIIMGEAENGQTEYITISYEYPRSKTHFAGIPQIDAEQYVTTIINWAYYSSNPLKTNVDVQWRLLTSDGIQSPIASRTAETVDSAESAKTPDPIYFVPSTYGDGYTLVPYIKTKDSTDDFQAVTDTVYNVGIVKNTKGMLETEDGMMLKLTALGRSNSEPSSQLSSWTYSGKDVNGNNVTYTTTFVNQPWTGNSGWNDDALWLNNGATAYIDCMPFSTDVAVTDKNGAVFEIEFETFNIDNEDAAVVQIGEVSENTASLVITGNSATLTSKEQQSVTTKFISDERIKLAFIICPEEGTDYPRMMFIQNNGVLTAAYPYNNDGSDKFNIDYGIQLGNALGKCGIKIYSIRVYSNEINMYNELNNFIIDSGDEMQSIVTRNDIYSSNSKTIDIDKLESMCTTIKITGDMTQIIAAGQKNTIYAQLEIKCPTDQSINLSCANACISNAGQSTLDLPVPSMHVKLDKNDNVCFDRDGNRISKNRWKFSSGNAPEKKFRLQCNYMDSSGCNNGAFLKMFNQVQDKVIVNGEYVLRTPLQKFVKSTASTGYSALMEAAHGVDSSGSGWAFPYNVNMVPDSIPCVVVWAPDNKSDFRFLGQYVIMEEKKANYSNGMHSVYDTITSDGDPDPYKFKASGGTRLWNNSNCYQFEILRNSHELTLFTGYDSWDELKDDGTLERENSFEMIYPDEDDITYSEKVAAWNKFFNGFVKPVCDTYGDYDAFNELYGTIMDKWHFAAYYILVLRNCCVDSTVRNMELTTYDGTVWLPKWWDVDMQCGMEQTGVCDVEPCSQLSSYIGEGTNKHYIFAGRTFESKDSETGATIAATKSWLWDALEHCPDFQEAVKTIDAALYTAGWNYNNITAIQDEQFVDTWSESIYNESSKYKYIDTYYSGSDHLALMLGSMKSRRHWFLKTSYDYYDALNVCGTYKSNTIYIRTNGAKTGTKMYFTAGSTTFFGWGLTDTTFQTGVKHIKGDDFVLELKIDKNSSAALNDPIKIYSATKLEKVDLHELAVYAVNTVQFEKTYDDTTGSILKYLDFGIPKADMANGTTNNSAGLAFSGLNTMSRLEYFNIQGLKSVTTIDLSYMLSLTQFYAAGSGITQFSPADGAEFTVVELPTTVRSITMTGGSLTKSELVEIDGVDTEQKSCCITWWNTDGDYKTTQVSGVTTGLKTLKFKSMGQDIGTHKLVIEWLHAIRDAINGGDTTIKWSDFTITYQQVNWTDMELSDLLLLANIPVAQRTITGYIKVTEELSSDMMNTLISYFGDTIFNKAAKLIIDCTSSKIIVSASGENVTVEEQEIIGSSNKKIIVHVLQGYTAKLQAVGFPIITDTTPTYCWSVWDGSQYQHGDQENNYYEFGENKIHYSTGVVTTSEYNATYGTDNEYVDYDIYVENTVDLQSGTATLRIHNRTYPTKAEISLDTSSTTSSSSVLDGIYQLFDVGTYTFKVTHSYYDSNLGRWLSDYTGTINEGGGVWTIEDVNGNVPDSRYVTIDSSTNTRLVLRVKATNFDSDYIRVKINYTSTWKNYISGISADDNTPYEYGTKITAETVSLDVVKVIDRVLVNSSNNASGNQKLFQIMEKFGFEHAATAFYTSYELKKLVYDENNEWKDQIDFYNIISALVYEDYMKTVNDDNPYNQSVFNTQLNSYLSGFTSLSSTQYNIPYFLRNIHYLNLSACTGITEVDITSTSNYRGLDLREISANAIVGSNTSLRYLYYGTPSKINIQNPDIYLNSEDITIQDVSRLSSIILSNFKKVTEDKRAYNDSYFNNEFKKLADIVDMGQKTSQTIENLRHVYLVDETGLNGTEPNIEKFSTGHEIESVASLLSTDTYPDRDQLDSSSYMKLNVQSQYAYQDEVDAIKKRFPDISLTAIYTYVRWKDRAFEKLLSRTSTYGGFGDGTGVVKSTAVAIERFYDLIKNNTSIKNLSDLSVCTGFKFPSHSSIDQSDFYGCTSIENITFPEGTEQIGTYTFKDLSHLNTLNFSKCSLLTTINQDAFVNCTGNVDVDLSKCVRLQTAYLNGLTNIGTLTINGASQLQTLVL